MTSLLATLHAIGLPEILACAIAISLTAYALMGGADYGGGVWDLLARGPHARAQRELIASSIGPIWEANHVWLVLVVVLLFTAFAPAFALLSVVLHIPLTIMLVGIVLRGSAFVFRSYGSRDDAPSRSWGRVFAVASIVTPIALGAVIGAVASGAAATAAQELAEPTSHSFAEIFVAPWLAPFPIAVGFLALALFAFLAAVYLAIAARDDQLREDFRLRALLAAAAVFVTAAIALVLAHISASRVVAVLTHGPVAVALHAFTAIAALTALWAIYTRRWRIARVAAAAQVALILGGWFASQYPYIVPPTLTIRAAAAPTRTLAVELAALVTGALVLIPSLIYLFGLFAPSAASTTNDAMK